MKKLVSLLLAVALVVSCFVGCGGQQATGYEIALITDKGNIDDKSFNQGAWEGVEAFAKENNITYHYYKPEEATDAGLLAAIQLAVDGGAKTVVCPGFLFETAIYVAQTQFPDTRFIILDGEPHSADYTTYKTENNVACVLYAEEEAGFLAGYAAVKEGFTTLGFEGGMAAPAVVAFGYGYLQGIEVAATEMGLEDGSVKVFYHYTGDFAETDANKATAKAMIQSGAQIIFGCGGSVGKSVFAAAAEGNIKTIGVDVNQKADSETVITSAMKGLGTSVQTVLASIYDNTFDEKYAGKTTYFTAANNGVGFPDDYERFTTFTKADYEAIYTKLADGTIDPIRAFDIEDAAAVTADQLAKELGLKKIVVEKR